MIVTGAFLAESATVVDNKLNVRGGVVDKFRASPDRIAPVTLVVLIQPQPFDRAPVIDVSISAPNSEPRRVVLDVPSSSLGSNVGFVIAPLRIAVPNSGDYSLTVSGQSGSVQLPLRVVE